MSDKETPEENRVCTDDVFTCEKGLIHIHSVKEGVVHYARVKFECMDLITCSVDTFLAAAERSKARRFIPSP